MKDKIKKKTLLVQVLGRFTLSLTLSLPALQSPKVLMFAQECEAEPGAAALHVSELAPQAHTLFPGIFGGNVEN